MALKAAEQARQKEEAEREFEKLQKERAVREQ